MTIGILLATKNMKNLASTFCYSTAHSSTVSSSVNNSNSNIVSSTEALDRGDRQVSSRYLGVSVFAMFLFCSPLACHEIQLGY